MAKQENAYFGINWVISLILAIFFGWILGPIVAFQRGNMLWCVIRILGIFFFFGIIFWVVDIVSFVVNKDLKWLI